MWIIRRLVVFPPQRLWLTIPFFLFLVIHKATEPPYSKEDVYFNRAFSDHIDYPVYNPSCAQFTGNVDSPAYLNYTSGDAARGGHLDFPVLSGNTTFPRRARYHFAVNTAPKSYLARREIRQSWARTLAENTASGDAKHACSGSLRFYVGQTDDKVVARRLHQELKRHSDMVFIEFCDKYETLPLKTFNIMNTVAATVPAHTQWIVKIDDDVLPNFPVFFDCLPQLGGVEDGIYGWVTVDKVSQDRWDKYRVVGGGRWNGTTFPGFSHGPAYALRAAVLPRLLATARRTPLVNLEDVWFTGIVAEAAGVRRFDVRNFIVAGRATVDLTRNLHDSNKAGFFYHNVGPRMMKKFWRKVNKCCGCRPAWRCDAFIPPNVTRSEEKSELILDENF